jgi:hypothetical protein
MSVDHSSDPQYWPARDVEFSTLHPRKFACINAAPALSLHRIPYFDQISIQHTRSFFFSPAPAQVYNLHSVDLSFKP